MMRAITTADAGTTRTAETRVCPKALFAQTILFHGLPAIGHGQLLVDWATVEPMQHPVTEGALAFMDTTARQLAGVGR